MMCKNNITITSQNNYSFCWTFSYIVSKVSNYAPLCFLWFVLIR